MQTIHTKRDTLINARAISKSFGHNEVLKGVDFDVQPGEVHALLGENGAGKTTLLRILSGRYQPTAGCIEINGEEFSYLTPVQAQSLGIEIVPQLVELVDDLPIADNIFLGRWPTRAFWINRAEMHHRSEKVLSQVGVELDPQTLVRDLTYVQKQMVEIARINQFEPRVIILDEPTAALSVREIEILFEMVNRLRQRGIGFVFVTHYLNEAARMSDRLTILRDGIVANSGPVDNFSIQDMVRHMVGDVTDFCSDHSGLSDEVVLSLQKTSTDLIHDFNLQLRAGEIVGLAAPKGEGVSEYLRALCRLSGKLNSGEVIIKGNPVRLRSPAHAQRCGLGYLSEDRHQWGLIPGRSVRENTSIGTLQKLVKRVSRHLDLPGEQKMVAELIDKFQITTPGMEADIQILSGGNQQKALVARLFNAGLSVYILDDPSFGVDVKSKAQVHRLIAEEASRGAGIILHSSDLDELLQMCDRILLIQQGHIAHKFKRGEVSLARLEELHAS